MLMNRTTKPTTTDSAPRVTPTELLEALDKKAAGLRERDRVLLAEQIRLERAGASPEPGKPIPQASAMARELLNGFGGLLPEPEPNGRLYQIRVERDAILIAVNTLGREEMRARAVALATMIQERGDIWREIVRERVFAISKLRKANQRAESFRAELAGLSGGYGDVGLACDNYYGDLFSVPIATDEGGEYLEKCVVMGFVTRKEIASC
jgi:hypothetical protein